MMDLQRRSLHKRGSMRRFWKAYTDLLDRKPIFVKSMTSLVGFALGDILAQVIAGGSYNLPRTLRMTSFGILMDGPIGEHTAFSLAVCSGFTWKERHAREKVSSAHVEQMSKALSAKRPGVTKL